MKKITLLLNFLICSNFLISQNLLFNEVLASNDSLMTDSYGDYDDWLEIYNNSSIPVNLNGYKLYDDPNITSWFFPDTTIAAYGYIVIWCDDQLFQNSNGWNSDMHANFKINKDGETVYFKDPAGNLVDTIHWYNLPTDTAWARIPNATGPFTLTTNYTFGANNNPSNINHKAFEEIRIFPIPSKSIFKINTNYVVDEYEIIDLYGRIVDSGIVRGKDFFLDLGYLKKGYYFIVFQNKFQNISYTRKIILN